MKTLEQHSMIRAAEVWVADDEGTLGPASTWRMDPFSDRAAGVIQHITETRGPVVFHQQGEELVDVPVSLSAEAGSAVFGLPIIAEGKVRAGLVLYLECLESSLGAVEVWCRDRRDELLVNGAVYANLGRFANISRFVRFPRASGLPGKSWDQADAELMNRLGQAPEFMRAAGARAGGLEIGVALPIMTTEFELHSVVVFLSSLRSPIAKVFEIWHVDESGETMRRSSSGGLSSPELEEVSNALGLRHNEGLVGTVWETGVPLVTDEIAELDTGRADQLEALELSSAIAVPVWVGSRVKSVFVMLS